MFMLPARQSMLMTRWLLVALLAMASGCSAPQEPAPLPAGCIAFGVFGDGPYRAWEEGRFRRVLRDVNRADLAWFIHVGDIFWYPCSDEHYAAELARMNSIQHPVIYTPGDNEWADCHEGIAGDYVPLDRLALLRRTFYADPSSSLGATPMRVETQAAEPAWAEFVENVRWTAGQVVCATIHLVGSNNALDDFPGRTAQDDSAQARRAQAGVAWLEETFAVARADSLHGVILAMHAQPSFKPDAAEPGLANFEARLRQLVLAFDGEVLLIHGDAHEYHVDHPMWNPPQPRPLSRFTRLETFGSPDIGWVRVVVDTSNGEIFSIEPRLVSRWWF
jgi:hypothetical protein